MKTAIVIGATGLVGKALVAKLAASDQFAKVITLTRRAQGADQFGLPAEAAAKIDNHIVDFAQLEQSSKQSPKQNPDQYTDYFRGDCLFSCLGTTLKQAGSVAAQRKVDVDYQLAAAKLAAQQGVSHYLLVSSSGANAHARSPYFKMKGELEQAAMQLDFAHISIFQPSLLIGQRPEFRFGELLGSWVLPTVCKLPGLQKFRPIKGEQVAEKMLQVSASTATTEAKGKAVDCYRLDQVFAE